MGATRGKILGMKHRCIACNGGGQVLSYFCPQHPTVDLCWACAGTGTGQEYGMTAPCAICRPDEWKKWKRRYTAPPGYQYGSPPFG